MLRFTGERENGMTPSHETDPIGAALAWGGLAVLTYVVYLVIAPFLTPLGWAAVLAIVFYPAHARLERVFGRRWAAAVSTLAVTLIIVVPTFLVMTAFVREALDAAGNVKHAFTEGRLAWLQRAWEGLEARVPAASRVDVAGLAVDAVQRIASFAVEQSGSLLRGAAATVFDLIIALFATFFLLRDAPSIMRVIRRLLPLRSDLRESLIVRTRELVSVSVVSSVSVAAVQGLLGGLVFALVGIGAPVFWGVIMGFFCLLPFGAWVIWLPAAIVLAASGEMVRALVLAALGAAIVSAADNILRPMLLSGRGNMNGLVILVSLLGGIAVFGMLGIVLGPLVVVTALGLLSAYVDAMEQEEKRAFVAPDAAAPAESLGSSRQPIL
jgi:predicted PurR-regulated permease PerM